MSHRFAKFHLNMYFRIILCACACVCVGVRRYYMSTIGRINLLVADVLSIHKLKIFKLIIGLIMKWHACQSLSFASRRKLRMCWKI